MLWAGDTDGVLNAGIGLVFGCLQFHGGYGAENLVGDVGEDGGAARGDAAFSDEDEKAGEKLVDGEGGVKLGELGEEIGGEVLEVAGRGEEGETGGDFALEMAEAEAGFWTGKAAAPAIGIAMQAARGVVFRSAGVVAGPCRRCDGNGIGNGSGASGFRIHGFLFLGEIFLRGGTPPGNNAKT